MGRAPLSISGTQPPDLSALAIVWTSHLLVRLCIPILTLPQNVIAPPGNARCASLASKDRLQFDPQLEADGAATEAFSAPAGPALTGYCMH
jgi:hypothetical protein